MNKLRFFLKKLGRFSGQVLIVVIRWYQKWISAPGGLLQSLGLKRGPVCVFEPSCSQYAIEAIQKYGIFHGTYLGVRRVLRCHPWQKNRYDPVE